MAAPTPHSPAEPVFLGMFLVYTLATTVAGIIVLRRWSRPGEVRTEPAAGILVPGVMLALSAFVFWVAEPFAQNAVLALFKESSQSVELASLLAGQVVVIAVLLSAWLTLPRSIAWAPTLAPEGEPVGPVDELRPAWQAFGLRPAVRGFVALCALGLIGSLAWKGIYLSWEQLHAFGLIGAPPLDDVQDVVESAKETPALTGKFQLISAFTVLGAPVAEELFFRGALYPAFKSLTRRGLGEYAPMFAAVLTGILFSWSHLTNSTYLPIFLFGWFLCLIRDRYGLLTCMAIHALTNLSQLVWLKLTPDVANL